MPIIITRGNNVYGPHQFPEKLIPKFIIRASRGADLPIHGNGDASRSYLYVEDVARAFDAVLHKVGRASACEHAPRRAPCCLARRGDCCGLCAAGPA